LTHNLNIHLNLYGTSLIIMSGEHVIEPNEYQDTPSEKVYINDELDHIGQASFSGCPLKDLRLRTKLLSLDPDAFDKFEECGTVNCLPFVSDLV
jgi:hypothetical protein